MRNFHHLMILLCGVILVTQTVGCSSLDGIGKKSKDGSRFNPFKSLSGEKEPDFQTPASMVAIWKASVFEKPGQKSIRGFGGRFYFYDAQNQPVRVDGDLTIYGYDDANKSSNTSGKADRKFVFKSVSLDTHFSESALGASYSFWVPWDEIGGFEKTITLIPVFKSSDGRMPEAKPSTMRLPGKKKANEYSMNEQTDGVVTAAGAVPERSMIRQANFEDAAAKNTPRRRPTTLRLSQRLADQMAQSQRNIGDEDPKELTTANRKQAEEGFAQDAAQLKPLPTTTTRPATPAKRSNVFGQPGSFR